MPSLDLTLAVGCAVAAVLIYRVSIAWLAAADREVSAYADETDLIIEYNRRRLNQHYIDTADLPHFKP